MTDEERRIQARRIGNEALDLDAGAERDAFVTQKCGGDQELMARVLTYIAGADDPMFDSAVLQPRQDPRAGQRIDRWILERKLGEGGLGVVYSALRSDGQVRQRGAIKFVRGTVLSHDLEQRFRDERQILANLNHPYIVGLLDGGVTAEGQPYLVMELVEDAKPLDIYCRQQQVSVKECLRLFQKVCQAVSYAHQKLVVHRDLKPGNILVSPDGTPHLLDFGVAKILDPIHRADGNPTNSSHVLMGTQRYFSPEQARMERLDTATDVYSLGVILYELLAGTDPYDFSSRVKEHVEQIICNVDPELPSRAVARSSLHPQAARAQGDDAPAAGAMDSEIARRQKELTGDLDAIVMQALRKERDERYGSVAEFSDDLQRHLDAIPVRARLNTLTYRLGRFVRRNRERVIAAAAALTILIGGLVATLVQNRQAIHQRQLAIAHELASYANQFIAADPQRALALAMYAVEATYAQYKSAVPSAENALREAVWLAHSGVLLPGAKGGDGLAFSSDGKLIAVAEGSIVELWDTSSGRKVSTISGHAGKITSVAISPDARQVATGGLGDPARLWDAATGRELRKFGGPADSATDVSFSPDGKLLASPGNGAVRVWDLDSGRQIFALGVFNGSRDRYELASLTNPPPRATGPGSNYRGVGERAAEVSEDSLKLRWNAASIAGAPSARRLFTSTPGAAASEWDVDSGRKVLDLGPTNGANQGEEARSFLRFAFSPKGDSFASIGDKTIRIWQEVKTQAPRWAILWGWDTHPEFAEALVWTSPAAITDVEFSADGKRMVTLDDHHGIVVSELQAGQVLLSTAGVKAVLSADGTHLATTDEDHNVMLWNVDSRPEPLLLVSLNTNIRKMSFRGDGQRLAIAVSDKVWLWDLRTSKLLFTLPAGPQGLINQLAFSGDGKRVAMIDDLASVGIWDASTGMNVVSIAPPHLPDDFDDRSDSGFALSADGKHLATVTDRAVELRDAVNGTKLWTVDDDAGPQAPKTGRGCLEVAFTPDGRRVATCRRGKAAIWDVTTGRSLSTISEDSIEQMELSPEGKRLLIGGAGTLRIWDTTTAQLLVTLNGNGPISSATFSPSGKLVAGCSPRSLIIWDGATGAQVQKLEGQCISLAFSPDSHRIASGGTDGTARVWDVVTGEELLTLKSPPFRMWREPDEELLDPSGAAGIAFSPDGKRLAVGGVPYLRVYDIDTEELLTLARERLVRRLTIEECEKYLHTKTCPAL
jgi:WD40 repeat protein/serine/threonine protein kinase